MGVYYLHTQKTPPISPYPYNIHYNIHTITLYYTTVLPISLSFHVLSLLRLSIPIPILNGIGNSTQIPIQNTLWLSILKIVVNRSLIVT